MSKQLWLGLTLTILGIALLLLSGSSASGATSVPKGTTITATEDSYLLTEEEADAVIIAYESKEIEADKNAEGLEKVMAVVTPMEQQLSSLTDTVAKMPETMRVEAKKAYWKGFKDGSILGFVVGGGVAYLVTR